MRTEHYNSSCITGETFFRKIHNIIFHFVILKSFSLRHLVPLLPARHLHSGICRSRTKVTTKKSKDENIFLQLS